MAQPSSEERFRFFLDPLPTPCPLCNCPRVTRVGLVDDVGIFRCADCDKVFTIPRTARVSHPDHGALEEP
jgi:transposase-like protein